MYGTLPSSTSLANSSSSSSSSGSSSGDTQHARAATGDTRGIAATTTSDDSDVRESMRDPPLPINNGTGALGLPTGVGGFGPTCFFTKVS